jgi:hypothetical protein
MDLPEIGWKGVDWINLTQDKDNWQAVVNTVTNIITTANSHTG